MAKGCTHSNAKFYAIQSYGKDKQVRLYNCPECHSTISEQTLRGSRR